MSTLHGAPYTEITHMLFSLCLPSVPLHPPPSSLQRAFDRLTSFFLFYFFCVRVCPDHPAVHRNGGSGRVLLQGRERQDGQQRQRSGTSGWFGVTLAYLYGVARFGRACEVM